MGSGGNWPTGIRPRGRGLHLRIWHRGRLAYQETIACDPYAPASLSAAIKRREQILARLTAGLPLRGGEPGPQIFADVAERWLASLQIGHRQIRAYWSILQSRWMPAYASWPVNEITAADIQERLAAFGVSVKTQKNLAGPLRGVLRHAGVNPNPCDALAWPRAARAAPRNRRRDRYSIEERDRLLARLEALADQKAALAAAKPSQGSASAAHWTATAALYFRIAFAIGARPGEILALEGRHYDGRFIWIEAQYVRGEYVDTTKTGRARRVYVPEALRPYLDGHPSRFTRGPILTGMRGAALRDTKRLNPWWSEAHLLERIPYRDPYTCRHTRAAELLSQGVTPAAGAAQLGHSVAMFSELYSEFIEEYAGVRDWAKFESAAQTPHKAGRGGR